MANYLNNQNIYWHILRKLKSFIFQTRLAIISGSFYKKMRLAHEFRNSSSGTYRDQAISGRKSCSAYFPLSA
jgi:hypothetical protein